MTATLDAAISRLVSRFRRQRPLRAGSLLITIFGDSIAPRGGAITLGSLIELAAPFGITERLVRTSVARLAEDEWLQSSRSGRVSEYTLTPSGRRKFAAATHRIYSGTQTDWHGRWTLVLFTSLRGPERQAVREELTWAGFGEPAAGVFMHPDGTPDAAQEKLDRLGLKDSAMILQAEPAALATNRNLVRAGWDLKDLDARYRKFLRAFEPAAAAIESGAHTEPENAFVLRTLLVHEYRRIHLRDPLLPAQLLPAEWAGSVAYELCRSIYAGVFSCAERHLAASGRRLDGALPPPSEDIYERFGGLERSVTEKADR